MIDKNLANKLWVDVFGNVEWARDCFGDWMHRDAWSNEAVFKTKPGEYRSIDCSWNVDHIRPKSSFENEKNSDFYNNFEPLHRLNNLEKSLDCPIFVVNGNEYEIFKFVEYRGYGIRHRSSNRRIDWKSVQKRYYE